MPKVFISHKDSDEVLAKRVAHRVGRNGLDVYLDSIDSNLLNDGPQLAAYLLEKMDECHQLVAVVSSSTARSWWVPWEIGVGSEKGFLMASYSEEIVDLPTYLSKWPSLRSMDDVDLYCRLSRATHKDVRDATATWMTESAMASIRREKAARFHGNLRLQLMSKAFERL